MLYTLYTCGCDGWLVHCVSVYIIHTLQTTRKLAINGLLVIQYKLRFLTSSKHASHNKPVIQYLLTCASTLFKEYRVMIKDKRQKFV